MSHSAKGTLPFALVEGPRRGDAEFYGKWLLAAAEAAALSEEAINDPHFEKQVDRLMVSGFRTLASGRPSFFHDLRKTAHRRYQPGGRRRICDDGRNGIFHTHRSSRQMVIPGRASMDTVKSAALKLAQTKDEEMLPTSETPRRRDAVYAGDGKRAYATWRRAIGALIEPRCCD